jgi:hypothetical protein
MSNKLIKHTLKERLNINESDKRQEISTKYSNEPVMYHCGSNFVNKFSLSYIKGGSRANHGWGVYFAHTVFKASDYGKYLTIVDRSNLKLLSFDQIISDDFINLLLKKQKKDRNNYSNDLDRVLKSDSKYRFIRDYFVEDMKSLEELYSKLEDKKYETKNIKKREKMDIMLNSLLEVISKVRNKYISNHEVIMSYLDRNRNKTIGELHLDILNNGFSYDDRELSLFFKKNGYDGFNYRDYEYVIFNPNKLIIIEQIII